MRIDVNDFRSEGQQYNCFKPLPFHIVLFFIIRFSPFDS